VPMLLRALRSANEPLDAVLARAMTGATQGVMQATTSRPQNQTFKPGAHGQDPDHDQ
jgi:mannose PTS system EIIA component